MSNQNPSNNPFGPDVPKTSSPSAGAGAAIPPPTVSDPMRALLATRSATFGGGTNYSGPTKGVVTGSNSNSTLNNNNSLRQSSTGSASNLYSISPAVSSLGVAPPVVRPPVFQSRGYALAPHFDLEVTQDLTSIRSETLILKEVDCIYRTPSRLNIPGTLTASIYHISFTPRDPLPPTMHHFAPSFWTFPVAVLRKIDKLQVRPKEGPNSSNLFVLDFICKDVRSYTFGFYSEALAEKVANHIRLVAFPNKLEYVQAFCNAPKNPVDAAVLPGWDLYDPLREFERQGVLKTVHPTTGEPLFRVSELNKEFLYSPTYPSTLIFPARASDAHMQVVSGFRSKARVPTFTWIHPRNKATLWRCSQPRIGMSGRACREDEDLIGMIRQTNVYARDSYVPLLVADCRPKVNAMSNKAVGGGYEEYAGTQLEFLDIENIHVVRDSFKKVEAMSLSSSPNDLAWTNQLNESNWLYNLRTVLSASLFVAESMHRRGQCVLVHCSDGWDRTAQLCALTQIFLDPYCRTIRGFLTVIAKDWISFGHKCTERGGHAMERDDGDFSPVFIQFLDAVGQFVRLFPAAFEFNEKLLLFIGFHFYSCKFGTFLGNCDRERREMALNKRTPSLWHHILSDTAPFLAKEYDPNGGDVLLPPRPMVLRNVELWNSFFMRYSPMPCFAEQMPALERYPPVPGFEAKEEVTSIPALVPAIVTPSSSFASLVTSSSEVDMLKSLPTDLPIDTNSRLSSVVVEESEEAVQEFSVETPLPDAASHSSVSALPSSSESVSAQVVAPSATVPTLPDEVDEEVDEAVEASVSEALSREKETTPKQSAIVLGEGDEDE